MRKAQINFFLNEKIIPSRGVSSLNWGGGNTPLGECKNITGGNKSSCRLGLSANTIIIYEINTVSLLSCITRLGLE